MFLKYLKETFRLGELTPYEKRLCLLLFLSAIPNSYPILQSLVTHFTPKHHCDISIYIRNKTKLGLDGSESPGNWSDTLLDHVIPWEETSDGVIQRSSCKQYNISSISMADLLQRTNQSFQVIPCQSLVFEGEATSAVMEFGFVCANSWKKPVFTSFYMIGNMIGGVLGGILSDRFGRRTAFLAFTAFQFIVAFITGFATSEIVYGFLVFCSGLGGLINYMAATIIGVEFVQPALRSFTYFAIEMGFSVGYALLAPIMYWIQDWRWFMKCLGLIGLLYIPFYWLIDETPDWLAATNKGKQAETIIKKVAKINKEEPKTVNEFEKMLKIDSSERAECMKMCWNIAATPVLFCRIVIVAFSWCVISMSYFTIALNTNSLSGSRFMNVFYAGLAEILATFLFYIFVEARGRRNSCMLCMGCCGLGIAITPLVAEWSAAVVVLITMLDKLTIAVAFNIIYVYTGELFPTTARQSSFGVCSSAARMGAILSPYLIHSGESGNTLTPSLGTAAALFLSLGLYVFLPETKQQELPQTINEAVNLKGGLKPRCCYKDTRARSSIEMSSSEVI